MRRAAEDAALVRRRAKLAGIEVPSLRSFQYGFAINCLRAGMDAFSLHRLLGHADLTVLKRYARQTVVDLRAVHATTSPVDRAGW